MARAVGAVHINFFKWIFPKALKHRPGDDTLTAAPSSSSSNFIHYSVAGQHRWVGGLKAEECIGMGIKNTHCLQSHIVWHNCRMEEKRSMLDSMLLHFSNPKKLPKCVCLFCGMVRASLLFPAQALLYICYITLPAVLAKLSNAGASGSAFIDDGTAYIGMESIKEKEIKKPAFPQK